jgi:hypothetical protein
VYLTAAETLTRGKAVPPAISNTIISLALEMNDRSEGLYQSVLDINSYERMNIQLERMGIPLTFSPVYLFFARSAFAQLFMEGNPSATGNHADLFQPDYLPADQLPYAYYSAVATTSGLQAEIAQDMTFYHALHY